MSAPPRNNRKEERGEKFQNMAAVFSLPPLNVEGKKKEIESIDKIAPIRNDWKKKKRKNGD